MSRPPAGPWGDPGSGCDARGRCLHSGPERETMVGMEIRSARAGDVRQIARLVNEHADLGEMLHRTEDELYEIVRDFHVACEDGRLAGCVALHVMDRDLAEIRSLVVDRGHQGRGLGRALVLECLREARELGIERVFALTLKPEFFEKLGFRRVPRSRFPQKIWRDCFKCRFFEACGEVAVEIDLPGTSGQDDAAAGERRTRAEMQRGRSGTGAK